jgi:A/G-specific adenine glycosylase
MMAEHEAYNQKIAENIIQWFEKEGRNLPWRSTHDPYFILVSEVMLQQTQVKTVIPYYLRFIEALPNFETLANASEDTLHYLWEGLGYYSRVRRLQQFAYKVVHEYEGKIPSEKEVLITMPGIGPYTCGALLSFCFNKKEPAMDGNVKRVLARLFYEVEDITNASVIKRLEQRLIQLLPDTIYPFNQGLIELGALYCTPTKPKCTNCPINNYCQAYAIRCVEEVPYKPKKMKQRTLHVPILVIQQEDEVLFIKRESTGLLASLWGLPMVQTDFPDKEHQHEQMVDALIEYLKESFNINDFDAKLRNAIRYKGGCKHVFSSIIWEQSVFYIKDFPYKEDVNKIENPILKWSRPSQISLPTAFKKTLRCFNDEYKEE